MSIAKLPKVASQFEEHTEHTVILGREESR